MAQQHIDLHVVKDPDEPFPLPEEAASLSCGSARKIGAFSTAAVFDLSGGRATY